MIPFNKPYSTGQELEYIQQALVNGKISGNGVFTQKCHEWFKSNYRFHNNFLTTSCTDALEMAALLCNFKDGDEFIVPSYTFVSTVNAFILHGGTPVFVDCLEEHPCIDPIEIEKNITLKTKVIVLVHYAGISCDMSHIMDIAKKYKLIVVEDAAQAIDSYYINNSKSYPLGSFGHFSTFSFHETKNIISGEGGMLVVNDKDYASRAEIIWEKGTNRSAFFRGEIDKYGWVDLGSSYLPSEIISAYLYSQLENLKQIQSVRKMLWNKYNELFKQKVSIQHHFDTITIPDYATNNAHMYYLIAKSAEHRDGLIKHLKSKGILAVFHYQSLHLSKFYKSRYSGDKLVNTEYFSERLIRLPLYYELGVESIEFIVETIENYCDDLIPLKHKG